jgi:hypothetical protein
MELMIQALGQGITFRVKGLQGSGLRVGFRVRVSSFVLRAHGLGIRV